MVGDEFIPTRIEMAQQYFDAAHMMLKSIKRGDWDDYTLVKPPSISTGIRSNRRKGLLGRATRTHDLAALADEFSAGYFARWQKFVPGWIIDRPKEIAAIDPGSTAFRYGENST